MPLACMVARQPGSTTVVACVSTIRAGPRTVAPASSASRRYTGAVAPTVGAPDAARAEPLAARRSRAATARAAPSRHGLRPRPRARGIPPRAPPPRRPESRSAAHAARRTRGASAWRVASGSQATARLVSAPATLSRTRRSMARPRGIAALRTQLGQRRARERVEVGRECWQAARRRAAPPRCAAARRARPRRRCRTRTTRRRADESTRCRTPSASATCAACWPPAPPKQHSAKRVTSWPRCTEICLIAFAMRSTAILRNPAASSSAPRRSPVASATLAARAAERVWPWPLRRAARRPPGRTRAGRTRAGFGRAARSRRSRSAARRCGSTRGRAARRRIAGPHAAGRCRKSGSSRRRRRRC